MTFTLSNFYQNEQYLSDRLSKAIGSNINLYLKTQSCELIADCLLIGKLKIRKIDCSDKFVNIVANDLNLETLYVNLPKKTLESGVDTNEAGNLRPVPILYGHLENAPAVVYIEEDQTTKLIPDDSYFSNNDKEIEGIKQFYIAKQNGYDTDLMAREYDNLISPNAVKVNLGSTICDVPCLPFVNSLYTKGNLHVENAGIRLFKKNQYETFQDYVTLNNFSDYYSHESILRNYNAMWLSKTTDLKFSREFAYSYFSEGTLRNDSLAISSGWVFQSTTPDFDFMDNTESHRVGFQVYEFDGVQGADRLDTKVGEHDVFPVDVHFIGNLRIKLIPTSTHLNSLHPRINVFFSEIKDDPVQTSHMVGGWVFGSPNEFTITNNSSTVNDNFQGRFWNTQRIDLRSHSFMGVGEDESNQYISYLLSEWSYNFDFLSNYWMSVYLTNVDGLRKGLDSNVMILAYSPDMEEAFSGLSSSPDTNLLIESDPSFQAGHDHKDMQVRKMWANKDILNKDFYVNAKGRVDTNVQYSNVYKIKGKIKVLTENELTLTMGSGADVGGEGVGHTQVSFEHRHQIELFRLLTNSKYKTKLIDNEVHELMIRNVASDGEKSYMWDIDVNNMNLAENYGDDLVHMIVNWGTTTEHRYDLQGWVYDITAKNYNSGEANVGGDNDFFWFSAIELVYAKINWADKNTISDIEEADEQTETFVFNEKNMWREGDWQTADDNVGMGYSYVIWLSENMELAYKLADSPPYIVKDILTNEMNIATDQIDMAKLQKAEDAVKNNKMAFSISEQRESREILEDICRQSRLTFRFRPSDNFAVVDAIYNSYDSDIDFDKEIDLDNAINYNFSKTKIEDLSVGGVKISYGYNYATQKPDKEVEVALSNSLEEYQAHYGIINVEDYKIEMNAPFISSEQSALELANYLLNYYKHQHLIIKCSFPCKDGFELEVGDVLKFNTNTTAFGKSLSGDQTNIDQTIYPLFYITKINKTLNKVDIECVQLHNLD